MPCRAGSTGSTAWVWRGCCIEAKSVLTIRQSSEADLSGTLENRNKPGIWKACSWLLGGQVDQFRWLERSMQQRHEGIDGLRKLGHIADSLMLRTGGCSGCALSKTCWTCRPLAKLYQEAKSPLDRYCQHGRR